MNTKTLRMAALTAMVLMALTSCATTPSGEGDVAIMETEDGAIMIETFTTTATVSAVDPATRKVKLTTPDGKETSFKAGPEVVNFDQIQVGDKITATVTEEVAISLTRGDVPPSASADTAVALAPIGSKPGVLMADTVEVTAKILAIDNKRRKVTLQFADGTTKKLKVGKAADLTKVKPGDGVNLRLTEGIAIVVEKP